MKRHVLGLAMAVMFLAGCHTTVNLAIKNSEKFPMNVTVDIKDKNKVRTNSIAVGDLPGGGNESTTFKIRNGGAFSVTGALPSGSIAFRAADVSVTGKPNFLNKEVVIKAVCRELDDSKGFDTLSKSFKNLGPDIGAMPVDLGNALDAMIGALVIAIPSKETDKSGQILFTVGPLQLDVYKMKLEDVRFPTRIESEHAEMSGSTSIQASGAYGPVAHFGITFSQGSVYQLRWVLSGFGEILKKEDPQKDPTLKINRLSKEHWEEIGKHLEENPGARLYYINKAYILEHAEMFVKQGKEISAGTEVDASSFVKAGVAYSFKDSEEKIHSYGATVINYWGDEYHPQDPSKSLGYLGTPQLVPTGKSVLLSTKQ